MGTLEPLMNRLSACVVSFAASVFLTHHAASAAEITVASALAFRPMLMELVPLFERSTGHHVTVVYGSAGAVSDRVRHGESIDVIISSTPMVTELVDGGKIPPGGAVRLARSLVAVA